MRTTSQSWLDFRDLTNVDARHRCTNEHCLTVLEGAFNAQRGRKMSQRKIRFHAAAFKHGAYLKDAVLPSEDLAEFLEFHAGFIAELAPDGPLEEEIVS